MSFHLKLTIKQRLALEYVGCHRKTRAEIGVGKPCSEYMLRKLIRLRLVMMNGDTPMLTYTGERHYSRLHPRSKYRVI